MESKKYYWFKLQNDFFTQKTIKKLRKIAGGDTYTIIYLKMQLLSLKDSGKLYFESVEDTFANELALEIDEDPENIQITLLFLEKHGLLDIVSENEYVLPETIQNIGSESNSASRVRKHRANAKTLQCNGTVTKCNNSVTSSNTEKKNNNIEHINNKQQHDLGESDDDVDYERRNEDANQYEGIQQKGTVIQVEGVILDKGERFGEEVITKYQQYGVTTGIVDKWLRDKGVGYLHEKLEVLEERLARGADTPNPAGFLHTALKSDYKPPKRTAKPPKQAKKDCPICDGTGQVILTTQDLETNTTVELKKDCRCLS